MFSVDCSMIGWAVVDSGIAAFHPAFTDWGVGQTPAVAEMSRVARALDFVGSRRTLAPDAGTSGLIDWQQVLPRLDMSVNPASSPTAPVAGRPYVAPADSHRDPCRGHPRRVVARPRLPRDLSDDSALRLSRARSRGQAG